MPNDEKSKKILSCAKIYSQVARYVNQSENMSFLLPSQVLAALSLELHFKALFHFEKNKDFKIQGRNSHNFYALFNELSEESKIEIKTHFENAVKNPRKDVLMMKEFIEKSGERFEDNRDFDHNLELWSRIFTEVRYMYEERPGKAMLYFPELEAAVAARLSKIEKSHV